MSGQLPIDRVRDRELKGDEPFRSDRETFNEKQAKLDREASIDEPTHEDEETFRERMEESLKESGKDSSPDP